VHAPLTHEVPVVQRLESDVQSVPTMEPIAQLADKIRIIIRCNARMVLVDFALIRVVLAQKGSESQRLFVLARRDFCITNEGSCAMTRFKYPFLLS
jgi:hypothetical protein